MASLPARQAGIGVLDGVYFSVDTESDKPFKYFSAFGAR